jgi:hypothetical protein
MGAGMAHTYCHTQPHHGLSLTQDWLPAAHSPGAMLLPRWDLRPARVTPFRWLVSQRVRWMP